MDQLQGPCVPCDWALFGRLSDSTRRVAACQLREGKANSKECVFPEGWTYEYSLSANPHFVPLEQVFDRTNFNSSKNGVDQFRDTRTNQKLYFGRTYTSDATQKEGTELHP